MNYAKCVLQGDDKKDASLKKIEVEIYSYGDCAPLLSFPDFVVDVEEIERLVMFAKESMIVYMSNGNVAWKIGDSRLATLYDQGYYVAPQGWGILQCKDVADHRWCAGLFGELRNGWASALNTQPYPDDEDKRRILQTIANLN